MTTRISLSVDIGYTVLVTDDDIGSIDHFILTKYNFSMHFKLGILLKSMFVIITEQKQRRDSQGNILLKVCF